MRCNNLSICGNKNYTILHLHKYEWFHAQNTLQMDIKMKKLFNRIALFHMLGMIGYICFVLPAAYFYFDNPYIVYSLLSIVIVLGLLKAFEEDRLMWLI